MRKQSVAYDFQICCEVNIEAKIHKLIIDKFLDALFHALDKVATRSQRSPPVVYGKLADQLLCSRSPSRISRKAGVCFLKIQRDWFGFPKGRRPHAALQGPQCQELRSNRDKLSNPLRPVGQRFVRCPKQGRRACSSERSQPGTSTLRKLEKVGVP